MLTRSLRQVVRGRVAGYVFQPITSRFLCSAQSPEAAEEAAAAAAVAEEATPLDMTEIRLSTDDTQEQAEVLQCECVRSPPHPSGHPIAPRRPPPLPPTRHSLFSSALAVNTEGTRKRCYNRAHQPTRVSA